MGDEWSVDLGEIMVENSQSAVREDLLRLKNYIEEWLDGNPGEIKTWTKLFAVAGHPNGMSSAWSNLTLKSYPKPETLKDIATAMGVPWETLLRAAGMISGGNTREESEFDLSPREEGLIRNYRKLPEGHQSVVFNQVSGMVDAIEGAD